MGTSSIPFKSSSIEVALNISLPFESLKIKSPNPKLTIIKFLKSFNKVLEPLWRKSAPKSFANFRFELSVDCNIIGIAGCFSLIDFANFTPALASFLPSLRNLTSDMTPTILSPYFFENFSAVS